MIKQLNEVQEAIVESGVRWSINILTEICGNYGRMFPPLRRDALRRGLAELHEVIGPEPRKAG